MYATTTMYQWKARPTDERIAVIQREIIDVLARSPGFRAYYNVRVSDTQTFTFVLWDDQASADAARAVIAPAQARLTEDIVAAPAGATRWRGIHPALKASRSASP